MREILFRGKTMDGKSWVEGYLIHGEWYADDNPTTLIVPTDVTIYPHCEISSWEEVAADTVGEWTGWVDKNGVKIFEGDVISNGIGSPGPGVVKWSEGEFVVDFISEDEDEAWWLSTVVDDKCTEIIGNIHDNPELLKGGKS